MMCSLDVLPLLPLLNQTFESGRPLAPKENEGEDQCDLILFLDDGVSQRCPGGCS